MSETKDTVKQETAPTPLTLNDVKKLATIRVGYDLNKAEFVVTDYSGNPLTLDPETFGLVLEGHYVTRNSAIGRIGKVAEMHRLGLDEVTILCLK